MVPSLLRRAALLFPMLLAIAGCDAQGTARKGHYPPNTAQKADTKFIRFVDKGKSEGVLESAIVTYEGKNGEVVELISAVHIADAGYYARLQKLFAGYDSLLYELIKPKGAKPPRLERRQERDESSSLIAYFQRFLRDKLKLEFQLESIDYHQANFVHADLDTQTFLELTDARGGLVSELLRVMLSNMKAQQEGKAESDPNVGAKLLVAMLLPDSSRHLKYVLAQNLQNVEEMMAGMGEDKDGKGGSVILVERNKALMKVLHARLEKGDKRIGVFYGGAHFADVEKRIFKEIGLTRTKIRWEKAWVIERQKKAETQPTSRPAASKPAK